MNYQKEASNIVALNQLSCDILEIPCPTIYFVAGQDKNQMLYNQDFHYISSDQRDIGCYVKTVYYHRKERVIYIHSKLFTQAMKLYTLLLRSTRYAYEIAQIKRPHINVDQCMVEQWRYDDERRQLDHKPVLTSPMVLDQNAYACILMNILFQCNPRFPIGSNADDKRYKKYIQDIRTNEIPSIEWLEQKAAAYGLECKLKES